MSLLLREFQVEDILRVKQFTDENIGLNYYSLEELTENQKRSTKDGISTSYLLVDQEKILGLRLAYPPGAWSHGKGAKLRPDLWAFPQESLGYFQSLFVSPTLQGMGYGPQLSQKSIEAFRKLGAKAILCHSWKESPGNSSVKYLENLGFRALIEHPDYWIDVDYVCTRDGKPCRCTAIEMILDL